MPETIQRFMEAGGVGPALVMAALSFFLGSAFLALADVCRALPEIAVNTRVLAFKSREGSSYLGLRVVGILYLVTSILVFVAGSVLAVVLLTRGGTPS